MTEQLIKYFSPKALKNCHKYTLQFVSGKYIAMYLEKHGIIVIYEHGGGGGGRLRDFFCDRSANLELVVVIVIS